jgi:hypothetical protein
MESEAHDVDSAVDGTEVDKVNTGALGTLVAVGLFAMLSITAAVTALVRHDMEVEESEKSADSNQTVIALKNSQRGMLNGPAGYVDRTKGLVSLPIDLAKSLVVSELERDPSSATPPALVKADTPVTAASGAGIAPVSDANRPAGTDKSDESKKASGAKPKSGKEHARTGDKPATSVAPASSPLSPTAASPNAEAPGPLNH